MIRYAVLPLRGCLMHYIQSICLSSAEGKAIESLKQIFRLRMSRVSRRQVPRSKDPGQGHTDTLRWDKKNAPKPSEQNEF